uniref:Protein phosphatase inhibitor 2 n=1 Tax=Varanus komodoensis TaxID=61221 RepID=A0A8D2JIE3_VARKO
AGRERPSGPRLRGARRPRGCTGAADLVSVFLRLCPFRKKSQKWDEMNILATYHPAGKDYGLMKIDEPSTPYHGMVGDDEDAGSDTETHEAPAADVLAKKLAAAAEGKGPRALAEQEESSDEDDDDMELSAEELEKKRQFEMKRKMHYNEAQNIKLARQLIAKELRGDAAAEDDDDDDEEMRDTAGSRQMNPAPGEHFTLKEHTVVPHAEIALCLHLLLEAMSYKVVCILQVWKYPCP